MTVQTAETQLPYPGDDPAGVGALARGLRDARGQMSTFDSEISTARGQLSSWQAAEAQAADARATSLARNGQLVGSALDSAAAAAGTYADTLTSARISVDGLREEWATASKQLNRLVDLGTLPAEELAIAQAQADKLTESLNEITGRYNRLVAQVADSVESCRRALGHAAQAASDTDSDDVLSTAGGLPSSIAADVAAMIADGSLPPEAAGMTLAEFISHAETDWALKLDKGLLLPLPAGSLLTAAMVDGIDLSTGMIIPTTTANSLAAAFATMSPEERTWMAVLYPRYLGSRDGVPFETRAQANRVMISAELTREQGTLQNRLALDAEAQRDKGFWDWNIWDDDDQDQLIADSRAKIELYQHLLDDRVTNDRVGPNEPATIPRQILSFDASRNGEFAELVGTIDSSTQNVGVLVPGTNTTLMGAQGGVDRVTSFTAQSEGKLAMIYWAAGEFPQNLEAAQGRFNDELAPDLVDFTAEVNRTVDGTGADIPVTVAGHSYGGATVGTAETLGLDADRILLIESAGAGAGVDSIAEYHNPNPDVGRYSMTAPGDFIDLVQGVPGGPHGADPDTVEGLTRLHTGNFPDGYVNGDGDDQSGQMIEGFSAHSNVFVPRSDAWWNMYNVFTGGEVTPYVAPQQDIYATSHGTAQGPRYWPDELPVPVPVSPR
jgi:hypothetical protein